MDAYHMQNVFKVWAFGHRGNSVAMDPWLTAPMAPWGVINPPSIQPHWAFYGLQDLGGLASRPCSLTGFTLDQNGQNVRIDKIGHWGAFTLLHILHIRYCFNNWLIWWLTNSSIEWLKYIRLVWWWYLSTSANLHHCPEIT